MITCACIRISNADKKFFMILDYSTTTSENYLTFTTTLIQQKSVASFLEYFHKENNKSPYEHVEICKNVGKFLIVIYHDSWSGRGLQFFIKVRQVR